MRIYEDSIELARQARVHRAQYIHDLLSQGWHALQESLRSADPLVRRPSIDAAEKHRGRFLVRPAGTEMRR